ncbi:unnamed protein product [Urochloa humidicola]
MQVEVIDHMGACGLTVDPSIAVLKTTDKSSNLNQTIRLSRTTVLWLLSCAWPSFTGRTKFKPACSLVLLVVKQMVSFLVLDFWCCSLSNLTASWFVSGA